MTSAGETNPDGAQPDARMQVIPTEDCYRLLAAQEIGRIGVNAHHYPLILPVDHGLDGTSLVIRTRPGTILRSAEHADVTFVVDEIDRQTRRGWSVLVRGRAEEVGDEHRAELVSRTHATGVEPWAPGEHGNWLRLVVHDISGRRIVPGELPPAVDPRGYL